MPGAVWRPHTTLSSLSLLSVREVEFEWEGSSFRRLVPALLARATGRLRVEGGPGARVGLVKRALGCRLEFLRLAVRLGVGPLDDDVKELLGYGDVDDRPEKKKAPTAAEARAATLERYEARKVAEAARDAAREALRLGERDNATDDDLEELTRDLRVRELEYAARVGLDDALSDRRELEMLEMMVRQQ